MGIDPMIPRAAVFLDRDGVINRNVLDPASGEYGAPLTAEYFELAPGAIRGMQRLRAAGFPLFLISNQPNFAKGKSTLEELARIHRRLEDELEAAGVSMVESYYCYHHPRGEVAGYSGPCDCRKPSPYFLHKAQEAYSLSLADSWIVGDRVTDIECGQAAGLHTIRVAADYPVERGVEEVEAEFNARDLEDAAGIILQYARR
jgi:D-glycero-D-manno-heptose 1,7-bisphosphate phosphatase